MKLSKEQIEIFEEKGFLLIENYFSDKEIECLINDIPVTIKENSPTVVKESNGGIRTIFAPERESDVFKKVAKINKIVEPMKQLIGNGVYLYQSKINVKEGLLGEWWQWHQDYYYWKREDNIPTSNIINFSIFLDDVDEFNGPMFIVPNTHKEEVNMVPNDKMFLDSKNALLSTEMQHVIKKQTLKKLINSKGGIFNAKGKAGTVLIFHGNILHASNANLSPFDRKVLFLTYNDVNNTSTDSSNPRPSYIVNHDSSPIETISDHELFELI
ncbi:phytanoyl-CoA dioxygenase family protein [Flavobacterium undicola]|uniref:phytanoyl-CoA dioxygenase family protein n=1 Tax=Flavobacterium undicola TaxID=1932779 RepID=UPI00137790DE|nr:phytanoyl-CoA dioxygenase family protein [Flavobacterium undicola]MBA0882486.1 phytanoyl-CoA dioxygenase family protein [Flavobacterium undicola]